MKVVITLSSLMAAVPIITAQFTYFSVVAVHSPSPIHLQPWSANGQRIWIGKGTASYCPLQDSEDCPDGTITNFAGGETSLAMGAEVPGGQLIYIDPACGAVMFTQAHSSMMPTAAITDGWSLDQGEYYGFLAWKNGLLACSTSGNAEEGPWEIYAQLDGIEFGEGCIGLNAITANETSPGAWQYT